MEEVRYGAAEPPANPRARTNEEAGTQRSPRDPAAGHDRAILVLKALAIVGVVLHHTRNRRLDPHAREIVVDTIDGFSWCVLLFLAISGWLHALSEGRSPKTIVSFSRSKLLRLLVPFVALVVLYASLWQLVQSAALLPLNGKIPAGFLAKLAASLWPVADGAVAEQLYFLPLVLLISIATHVVLRLTGERGVLAAGALALGLGIALYPHASNTGFSLGVAAWGSFSYAAGFCLYRLRHWRGLPLLGIACGAVAIAGLGLAGLPKAVPVILLSWAQPLRLERLPLAPAIGEASGTIFAYHTPFVLQPLMLLATRAADWRLQLCAILLATGTAIALTFALYRLLRDTRFKFLLL